jgi:hypothetical protein
VVSMHNADTDQVHAARLTTELAVKVDDLIHPDMELKSIHDLSPRELVHSIELEMLKQPQIELPVRHYFSPGVYARELLIPANTILTGKIHKYPHLCIMSAGDMSVLLDDGIKRVQAPFTTISPAGTKRIAYAHADTIWTTIHATDETDLDKIEALFVAQDEAEYREFLAQQRGDAVKCLS